jgi:hypothetical protein
MLKKAIYFIKYNNITVLILAIIFLLGTGVFAQTETGKAVIGAKQTNVEGVDNTLLLEADLDAMNMDFKIEKIESDDPSASSGQGYYYITYTYIDLVKQNNAWQYQMQEKVRKVSQKLKEDLGQYLAEELGEEYELRIKELKEEQAKAKEEGEEKRLEVVEYNGLIGQTLNLAGKIFPGYEPVKKREVPSPALPADVLFAKEDGGADDLTDIYNEYMEANDPDKDNVFGELDNCPLAANADQADSDEDGIGDACDEEEELPEESATSSPEQSEEEEIATSSDQTVPEEGAETEVNTSIEETSEEPASTEATEDEEPNVEIIELPTEDVSAEEETQMEDE